MVVCNPQLNQHTFTEERERERERIFWQQRRRDKFSFWTTRDSGSIFVHIFSQTDNRLYRVKCGKDNEQLRSATFIPRKRKSPETYRRQQQAEPMPMVMKQEDVWLLSFSVASILLFCVRASTSVVCVSFKLSSYAGAGVMSVAFSLLFSSLLSRRLLFTGCSADQF